jgi:secreted trypsin-like serine protease
MRFKFLEYIMNFSIISKSNGDSGGPLMKYGAYPNAQTPYYMLVGIVSFGPKNCGTKDIPGNFC